VRGAGDGHGAARRRADALRERQPVLEVLRGEVAGGARDAAVAAQSRVEEELLAERGGARVVGDAVRRVGGERAEAREREGAQRRALLVAPARAAVAGGERGGGER
jgi:hypothetical protein